MLGFWAKTQESTMKGKRHKTEEIIRILYLADGGQTVKQVCREALKTWRSVLGRSGKQTRSREALMNVSRLRDQVTSSEKMESQMVECICELFEGFSRALARPEKSANIKSQNRMVGDRLLDLLPGQESSPDPVEKFDIGDFDMRRMHHMVDLESLPAVGEKAPVALRVWNLVAVTEMKGNRPGFRLFGFLEWIVVHVASEENFAIFH